jgi:hypothetical protein
VLGGLDSLHVVLTCRLITIVYVHFSIVVVEICSVFLCSVWWMVVLILSL